MIPTLFFVITLVNIKAKNLNYNLKNLKKCKSNILLMILGITLAIYVSVINVWNLFFSIPIIITSIELVLTRYIELCSDKEFVTSEWYARSNLEFKNGHITLKDKISSEELKIYKKFKWNEIFLELEQSLALSFFFTMLAIIPLNYFNLMTPKYITIVYILFFIKGGFIRHIIDYKFNLFTKMTGICVEITLASGGKEKRKPYYSHKIVDFKNKNITTIVLDRRTYKIGTRLTVIYGALSKTVIGFF